MHVERRVSDGPGNPSHGEEPHDPDQALDRGLADLADDDADQEKERGGASEDAHMPPFADAAPSLADRGNAAGQEEDRANVRHRLGK
ncbi:MAG TPA: hypothetical protein DHU96_20130 [Actinobacteria bacterium]|nr:hypothetical protein [Actinomycetota bacterium]